MSEIKVNEIKAILPRPTADSLPFWNACNDEQFLMAHCKACDHLFYYPRRLCPACGGSELGWNPSAGRGTVYSHCEVHVSFYGPTWASQLPYTVLLVDLDEGPRLLSRLISADGRPVAIGERVQLKFIEVDGQRLPYFEPLPGDIR